MAGRIEKTVFISYRRTNFWTALAVFQNLHSNGYDVFFDYKSIPSGDFEQVITESVKSSAHFLVILSPSALDRCNEPGDWLRREIEIAIDSRRNIIPLIMEGFDFGTPATINILTGKLSELKKYQTLSIPAEYFEEAMNKLRSDRYLNRPLEFIYNPVSDVTRKITEAQKLAASEAVLVEKEELSAQEWFERGYKYYEDQNTREAIRCYNEAINLKSEFAVAYLFRGFARQDEGDIDGAVSDFDLTIGYGEDSSAAYFFRGDIFFDKGNFDRAIADYTEAIRIEPDFIEAYNGRGVAYGIKGKLNKALQDFNNAIRIQPKSFRVYGNRGNIYSIKGDGNLAINDYSKVLELNPNDEIAYFNRGGEYYKKGDLIGAIADYEKYLELSGEKQDDNQREVKKRIVEMKNKLVKRKPVKKQRVK